jgi:LPXTG-site transpeptidase (sortase) family protein
MTFFTEATPLRKALIALGGIAFVAGLVLIAIAAVSVLGGGDDDPVVEVRDLDRTPLIVQASSPTPLLATDSPTPVPTPPLREGDYTMIIDKLNVNAPVQTYGLDASAIPEVPTGAAAADVVAWYNFSAQPGTGSNAVFAGHVTWFGPAVFISLKTLSAGDEVVLRGSDGAELLYVVSDVFQVDANDPDALSVMSGTDQDVITLITCDGAFVDTNDPIFGGEYSNRLVVRAQLTETNAAALGGS